jgi:hypothetical protein
MLHHQLWWKEILGELGFRLLRREHGHRGEQQQERASTGANHRDVL